MMNHFAQECRAGSVLTKLHALCAIREMCGCRKLYRTTACDSQRFALNPHQCTVDILLHRATGRGVRLNCRRTFRREDLYSDTRQE